MKYKLSENHLHTVSQTASSELADVVAIALNLFFLSSSYSGSSVGNSYLQTGQVFLEPNQGTIHSP
ncbi:hypothetical protein HanRHA438_Chr12g0549351 [Helianthus annuus]|nr:hypothetical protein HanRHA438_Chr12g0549351 [Helianthus annuus]